jgi:pilus assembly protein CpaF
MDALMRFGSLNAEVRDFLAETVGARCTTLISGGTGTGKTTLVNALSEFIPNNERVLTIEDAFELSLTNDHVVSLQTHERASADDETIIGQAELLVWALRARPDRIIVGEIREGDGALVMLQAATTGHEGTMTTIHANSAEAALNERFVDLVREASSRPDDVAKRSVAMALNLVIQVTRTPAGRRYISEISVVDTSCIVEGRIVPDPIFVGELDSLGVPQFRRVAHVRPETETGKKLNAYREEQAQR